VARYLVEPYAPKRAREDEDTLRERAVTPEEAYLALEGAKLLRRWFE